MFDRPHQRGAWIVILVGAVCLGAAVGARAGDDADAAGMANPPATSDIVGRAASAEPADLPVPEQERQGVPLPSRPVAISESSPTGSGSWVLQTLTALGIVIGLIFALRALLMRITGTQAGVGGHRLVEVLARATIGHKTQVVFLKIHQRVVVAAQTPSGMDTLTTIDDPEEVAWLLGQVEAAKPASITQSFRKVMHRFDRDYPSGAQAGGDTSEQYVDRTRDQLSGLMSRIRHLKGRPEQ